MECEFDNTDIEGTAFIEWRHVSGIHTHLSMKCCLQYLKELFWKHGNATGVAAIVYFYAALLKMSNQKW